MTLDQMLDRLSQAQSLADLDQLLDDKTLIGILNSWLFDCEQANFSGRTLEHYRNKVSEFLRFLGPKITRPDQVKPVYIALFLAEYRNGVNPKTKKPHKPSSESGYYRSIHRYFEYMKEKHIIESHPMSEMKPPKVPKTVIIPYSKEEIRNMIELCEGNYKYNHSFTAVRNRAMILIYLSSGIRRKEMSEILLENVNIKDRTIKVMGKGAKERFTGFGVKAAKALLEYFKLRQERVKGRCSYLWLSEEGTQLSYWGVGLAISDVKTRANIKKESSTHALRHTFATESLKNGARREDVQRLMGHEDPKMTQHYQETVDSETSVKEHPKFDPVDHMDF